MSIDKKSKQTISNILSAVLGEEPVKIYQEVALNGVSSEKVQKLELTRNKEELKNFTPFHRITKDIKLSNDKRLKDFHKEVMEKLRTKKQLEIPVKKLEMLLSNNNVLKNISNAVTSLASENVKFTEEHVEKAALFSKKAKDTELLRSYLILKNEKMESSAIQVLSKGLRNIENPETNKWVPKNLIKSVGMIQMGLALNSLATTPIERNKGEKRKEDEIKIRNYAQAGSHSSTAFLTSCKLIARDWEEKHLSTLIKYAEKQRERHEKEANLLNKVNEAFPNKTQNQRKKQRVKNTKP